MPATVAGRGLRDGQGSMDAVQCTAYFVLRTCITYHTYFCYVSCIVLLEGTGEKMVEGGELLDGQGRLRHVQVEGVHKACYIILYYIIFYYIYYYSNFSGQGRLRHVQVEGVHRAFYIILYNLS